MTSVLVADDQDLVRVGLCTILERREGIDVVGEAADGLDAVDAARRARPDVVLMDIRMPRLDGIEATRRVVAALGDDVRVLMLTTFGLDEYVYDALRAGASGFMLKDAPADQLATAIRVVAAGDALLAPSVTRRLVAEFARRPLVTEEPALEELTVRELDVLKLVARGLSNAEISRELFIGDATVKTHVKRVLAKLDLCDRVQAVVLAYESGLVQPGLREARADGERGGGGA